MAPLQSIVDQATGWLSFAAVLLIPGVAATVLWLPFLAARRIRALFTDLPPSGRLAPTYLLVGIGGSLPYVVGFLAVVVFVDSGGVAWSNATIELTIVLSVLYAVGLPAFCVLGLPRIGFDWDPAGYGWSTWALLVAGGVWYAALFAVPLLAVSFVMALPGGY